MQGLACPRCYVPLQELRCDACAINFSQLGDVYWMWPDPVNALLDWRNRFNFHLSKVEAERARALADREPITRTRSNEHAKNLDKYSDEIRSILQAFNISESLAPEIHSALKTQLPDHHGLDAYNPNIFRDWVWGVDENQQTCELIVQHIQSPGDAEVLVLGAGAGRLAYDLHSSLSAGSTWALDSNPLLAAIASVMFKGEAIEMTEFPLAPLKHRAIPHTLTSPGALTNLHSVCGDALAAPFAANSFDIVVTPWLIDVIDNPLIQVLEHIASLLKPGGIWINHGSLNFESAQPGERYTADELSTFAKNAGFKVQFQRDTTLPYLQSPYSRQKRVETTHTLICTVKAPLNSRPKNTTWVPEWINNPSLPIPLEVEFQTQITSTRVANFIMGHLDGQRSISDIAEVMEAQRLMPKLDALGAIRNFLKKMQAERLEQQRRG